MYAIVDDRNQQYRVSPGDKLRIALRADAEKGEKLTFDRICMVGGAEGEQAKLGTPYVGGARVTATVLGTAKGPKVYVQKFKRRKNQRRRTGFRARFTEIQVDAIEQ